MRAAQTEPRWRALGPVATLFLVLFLVLGIVALLLQGLFLVFSLGFLTEEGPSLWAYGVVIAYFAALVMTCISFIQGRLWPLLAMIVFGALLFAGFFSPLFRLLAKG